MSYLPQPLALSTLLSVFVEGTKEQRISVARIEKDTQLFLSDQLESISRMHADRSHLFRAQTSLFAIIRLIWSMVPARLLNAPSPDFRSLAERELITRFGDFPGSEETIRNLTTVFKRIRQYSRSGRQAQSLNLDLVSHVELFESQKGRCNHCGYEFKNDIYLYAIEDDGVCGFGYDPIPGEIALNRTLRRPELDHIIPLILGGDNQSNWQILCKSCNLGKSDQVGYLFSYSGQQYNRIAHLFDLSHGKRYGVIADSLTASLPNFIRGDGKFYRIFKREPSGLANPENLKAIYA